MTTLPLPPINSLLSAKVQPRLMKDTYKKVHIYLFDFHIVLGKGSFSKVYKGINLNTSIFLSKHSDQQVAVKVIQMGSINTPKLKQLLLQQIDILMKIKHQNLIKCFQVLSSSKNTYIIMELCTHDFGSVCDWIMKEQDKQNKQFLQKQNHKFMHAVDEMTSSKLPNQKSTKQTNFCNKNLINQGQKVGQQLRIESINSISSTKSVEFEDQDETISENNLLQNSLKQQKFYPFIKQIFQGLEYLHSQNILHRDLKLSNIFLNPNQVCKIGDFGFATIIQNNQMEIRDTCCIGSPLYMSPQSYLQNIYSKKSDVWSFGVLIFQMIYGNPPLWNCPTHEILKAEVKRPIRLQKFQKLAKISDQMKQVIEGCMQVEVRKRFTVQDLKQTRLFKRLLYSPLESKVVVSSRNHHKIQESHVQILGIPLNQNIQTKSIQQDKQLHYQNFSTIQPFKQDFTELNTLNFYNNKSYLNKFNKTDTNYIDRKTQKTQTLKHNNSCMKFETQVLDNNSFTDRGRSIDNSTGGVRKQITPPKIHQNSFNNNSMQNEDFFTNRSYYVDKNNSKDQNKPQSNFKPSTSYGFGSKHSENQNQFKFKSTDLNGNIFKEINKMNLQQKQLNKKDKEKQKQKNRNSQFYYKSSEGMKKYLQQIKQAKFQTQIIHKPRQKTQKTMTFNDLSNILYNSPIQSTYKNKNKNNQSESPKFASTFQGPFYTANKNSRQSYKKQNIQQRDEKDLIKASFSTLQMTRQSRSKPQTSYSPRITQNYSSSSPISPEYSNKKTQEKQYLLKQESSLLTKNYSVGNFSTSTNNYLNKNSDSTQKYEYKKKLLEKCTSSPKFQAPTSDTQQKNHRYMSTSSFFGSTNYCTSPKSNNSNNKQNISNFNKDFNAKEDSYSKNTSKKSDIFMKTFDGSNQFLSQFPSKIKQQPSQIQKKTYWKANSKNYDYKAAQQKIDNKFQSNKPMDNDQSTSSLLSTQRTSCLYGTSTQKPKQRSSFTRSQTPLSSVECFRLLTGEIIIKDACQLIHFCRLLHKLSFTTESNSNSITLLQYSIQLLNNLLQKCQNFQIKYHYDSSANNSQSIRQAFKANQQYLQKLAILNEKECYVIKKDIDNSKSTINNTSKMCNKAGQLKEIIQTYIKKYTQRKQALIKLFQCNTLFENLSNKVKQPKSSFMNKPQIKKRTSLISDKGYVNFSKLQKLLQDIRIEITSKKQSGSSFNSPKSGASTIGHRVSSQYSGNTPILISICQCYIEAMGRCIRQQCYIELVEIVQNKLKTGSYSDVIKNFSNLQSNEGFSLISQALQSVSFDNKRSLNQQLSSHDSLSYKITGNFSMIQGFATR